MTLPNFIIPGAPKSGTTSLHIYLDEHPEILMSNPKEPYFFCGPITEDGLEKYKSCFKYSDKKKSVVKAIGESSSVYFNNVLAPVRVKKILGEDVKFIFLLRNPVERTISAYFHMVKRDADKRIASEALSFDTINREEVILLEKENLDHALKQKKVISQKSWVVPDEPLQHFYYVRNSFSSIFIKRYLKHFPLRNFLFVLTDDLKNNPEETIKGVEDFLDIDNTFIPKGLGIKHNQTFLPKKSILAKIVHLVAPFIAKYITLNSRIVRKSYSKMAGSSDNDINSETKDYLKSLFRKEITELGKLIGRDLTQVWR